ncbi:hypothetical protein protein [Bacillus cereus G9241]|nr:hypothetical protein protein [Bacillus cereus G9241]
MSYPTTSGSPPVTSISLSDHNFSGLAFSFTSTLAHSRPSWRFILFSKRACNTFISSSRCSTDNSFLFSVIFVLRITFPYNHNGLHTVYNNLTGLHNEKSLYEYPLYSTKSLHTSPKNIVGKPHKVLIHNGYIHSWLIRTICHSFKYN